MKVRRHGLGVDAPPGWEVRIARRPADAGHPAARPRPVLHAATVPLPEERGDYGSNITPSLRSDDVFVSLFEHGPEAVGTALFAAQGLPRLSPGDFAGNALQRTIPGQSGVQYFFTHQGRAFCLYVVLGSHARRAALVRKAQEMLTTLVVERGDFA